MFDLLQQVFSYTFMVRAILVGLPIALCAALLGISLVLKHYSMIGDGLSHVAFGTLAIALALNVAPMQFSLPIVIITAILLLRLSENNKIKGDAAIALISSSALALGVLVVSLTTGMNTDIYSYLFGSILAVSESTVFFSLIISITVTILFFVFYNKIFAVTFDEPFAKATGTKTSLYNMLVAILTAVTIVIGIRIMGALLISSLIIFPALTSMRVCISFRMVVIVSAIISVCCFLIGILLSFFYSTPTGASIVLVNLAAFLLFSLIGSFKNRTRPV